MTAMSLKRTCLALMGAVLLVQLFWNPPPDDRRRLEARPTILAYSVGTEDRVLFNLWHRRWYDAGWNPIALTPDDAQQHPAYDALLSQQRDLPPDHLSLQWLAAAQAGGGWMADLDVFPLRDFRPATNPNNGRFTLWEDVLPSLVSGTAGEYERAAVEFARRNSVERSSSSSSSVSAVESNVVALIMMKASSEETFFQSERMVVNKLRVLNGDMEGCHQGKIAVHFDIHTREEIRPSMEWLDNWESGPCVTGASNMPSDAADTLKESPGAVQEGKAEEEDDKDEDEVATAQTQSVMQMKEYVPKKSSSSSSSGLRSTSSYMKDMKERNSLPMELRSQFKVTSPTDKISQHPPFDQTAPPAQVEDSAIPRSYESLPSALPQNKEDDEDDETGEVDKPEEVKFVAFVGGHIPQRQDQMPDQQAPQEEEQDSPESAVRTDSSQSLAADNNKAVSIFAQSQEEPPPQHLLRPDTIVAPEQEEETPREQPGEPVSLSTSRMLPGGPRHERGAADEIQQAIERHMRDQSEFYADAAEGDEQAARRLPRYDLVEEEPDTWAEKIRPLKKDRHLTIEREAAVVGDAEYNDVHRALGRPITSFGPDFKGRVPEDVEEHHRKLGFGKEEEEALLSGELDPEPEESGDEDDRRHLRYTHEWTKEDFDALEDEQERHLMNTKRLAFGNMEKPELPDDALRAAALHQYPLRAAAAEDEEGKSMEEQRRMKKDDRVNLRSQPASYSYSPMFKEEQQQQEEEEADMHRSLHRYPQDTHNEETDWNRSLNRLPAVDPFDFSSLFNAQTKQQELEQEEDVLRQVAPISQSLFDPDP